MTEREREREREPKTQTFAETRRFSQIHPFSWKFKHLEGTGNHRKPQIFAENRRKPQIGFRHLRCVTFSSALVFVQDSPQISSLHNTTNQSNINDLEATDQPNIKHSLIRMALLPILSSWWTFRIFLFFLFGGGGKGGGVRGGQGMGGGYATRRRGQGRAPGGECLWGGRGAKFFFVRAEMSTKSSSLIIKIPFFFSLFSLSHTALRNTLGKALRAFPGSFRNFARISSGKSQRYWGCGLLALGSCYRGVRSPCGAIGSPYGGIRSRDGPLLIV